MLESVRLRYEGCCMMLMSIEEDRGIFLGSAFLVHSKGYALTAAHILPNKAELGLVPAQPAGSFVPLTMEQVTPVPVEVVRRDTEHDVALLKLIPDLGIAVPSHIMGNPAETPLGTTVMSMGFSFAHYRLHSVVSLQATLSAKVLSAHQAHILLFDTPIHPGDAGGPLINARDERIIGVVLGPFAASDLVAESTGSKPDSASSAISQAISIEYGIELMKQEGLDLL